MVIREASTKSKMKKGNTFFREKRFSLLPPERLAPAVRQSARASVMGMMANVRVSFTIVA